MEGGRPPILNGQRGICCSRIKHAPPAARRIPVAGSLSAPVAVARLWCAADVTVAKCIVAGIARWKHGAQSEEGSRQVPATSRGRKMHAERSRRYLAQHRRVTDQGSIPLGMPNLPATANRHRSAGAASRCDRTLAQNFLLLLRKTCLGLRSSVPNSPASPAFNRKALRPAKAPAMTLRRQIYADLCRR
jgi:hypothetical protein